MVVVFLLNCRGQARREANSSSERFIERDLSLALPDRFFPFFFVGAGKRVW